MSRPLPPELELYPDPVLGIREVSLSSFVIDTDHDVTMLAAVIDRDPWPAIFKTLLYLAFPKLTDELLPLVLIVCVME